MRRVSQILLCCASLWWAGCDQDPARSVKILPRPPKSRAGAVKAVTPVNWRPRGCPPLAEESEGPGLLKITGPCAFEHQGAADCKAKLDDFFVITERKSANGAKLTIFLNVENYHGPGDYLLAQMHFSLQEGPSLYRWSSDNVAVTVGPEEAYVTLPTTRLEAEPLLNTCPPIVAADGSYTFPCSAQRVESPSDGTLEVLSGKMVCAKSKDE